MQREFEFLANYLRFYAQSQALRAFMGSITVQADLSAEKRLFDWSTKSADIRGKGRFQNDVEIAPKAVIVILLSLYSARFCMRGSYFFRLDQQVVTLKNVLLAEPWTIDNFGAKIGHLFTPKLLFNVSTAINFGAV